MLNDDIRKMTDKLISKELKQQELEKQNEGLQLQLEKLQDDFKERIAHTTEKDVKQQELEEQFTIHPHSVTECPIVSFQAEDESEYHLMASNISFSWSVEDTKHFFRKYGELTYFRMPLSKNNKNKYPHGGKAFFGYRAKSSETAASMVSGTRILGRELTVKVNKPHY